MYPLEPQRVAYGRQRTGYEDLSYSRKGFQRQNSEQYEPPSSGTTDFRIPRKKVGSGSPSLASASEHQGLLGGQSPEIGREERQIGDWYGVARSGYFQAWQLELFCMTTGQYICCSGLAALIHSDHSDWLIIVPLPNTPEHEGHAVSRSFNSWELVWKKLVPFQCHGSGSQTIHTYLSVVECHNGRKQVDFQWGR